MNYTDINILIVLDLFLIAEIIIVPGAATHAYKSPPPTHFHLDEMGRADCTLSANLM